MGDYNQVDGIYHLPTPEGDVPLRGQVVNQVKINYEDWLEGRARRRVFDLRHTMTTKEFNESLQACTEASATYTLAWGGDAWRASLKQMPGIIKMVVLLAQDADPGTKVDETRVLGWLADEKMATMLVRAVQEILHATPNFLSPPMRAAPH